MSRHKGKSQRRIKDWRQKLASGDHAEDQASARQRIGSRGVKLPPRQLEVGQEQLDDLPRAQGMLVGVFPGGTYVRTEMGELLCGIAGTFRAPPGATPLAVGDQVTVALTRHQDAASQADKDRTDGIILLRQPRRTLLARPQPRSGKRRDDYSDETFEKVIAANMDVLLIVAATRQPALRHGLIDRFLIIAERGELQPVLVINKIDLGRPDEQILSDFAALGVAIHLVSAQTGEGVGDLLADLGGRRSILAGASGVGKSTLINALIPGAQAATREVRMKDERGRHTTSSTDVYDLPAGGLIIDTPGVRELGIQLRARELPWYFPEFEAFAHRCKFNDCSHTHEPACAIIAAVEQGQILARRYDSYLRILETIEDR